MAKLTVNIGTSANDRTGDNLRTAFNKINQNFDEVYLSVDTLTSQVATITGSGTSNSASGNTIVGDIQGSVVGEDSTVLVDGVNSLIPSSVLSGNLPALDGSALTNLTIPAQTFASLTGKPTTLAGYGITDAATLNNMAPTGAVDFTGATSIDFNTATINNLEFADISTTPTTLAGYGITDAATLNNMAPTGAVDFTGATSVDFTGATITGTSFLTSYTETDPVVGAITGIVKADGAGNISAAVAGTDYLTTVAFSDLTGTPTTLAGYGITDAVDPSAETTFTADVKFDTGVEEKFATLTGSTGVTAMDCANGHVHYLTGASGDITANFTNLGLTAEYATNLTVIINQGATPYEVTAVQIGGAAQTIEWQGGVAPTGNANGIDSFSFTILNDGGTYVVLGQMVDFT